MKKLLVLAMILVLAAPLFAEMSIGGEFDYYMVNGFDGDGGKYGPSFVDLWDKGEIDFNGTVGDYSQIKIEVEDDQQWPNGAEGPNGTPRINYFRIVTDWGKFFGLDGIGIKTDIGLNSFETFDNVSFTGFCYEDADSTIFIGNPSTGKNFGAKVSLNFVDGLVQPYFAWRFDTVQQDKNGHPIILLGSGFDFNAMGLPLWFEAYYFKGRLEDDNLFGVEAMYDLAIGDMDFKIGGHLENATATHIDSATFGAKNDDRGTSWGFGVKFAAFGATFGASTGGYFGEDVYGDNSAFSVLGLDAGYDILDWLAVNAGLSLAFSKFKENACGDKAFQTFEAGVIVKPDKGVKYKLGYIYANKDAKADGAARMSTRTLNTKRLAGDQGGLYFVTQIDF